LQPHHKRFQFLSIYNTTNDSFRDDDLARLNSISLLMGYPAQEQDIKEVLAS
jgi:hypothetical protein